MHLINAANYEYAQNMKATLKVFTLCIYLT